ncbi:MAG: class I SAM-dependent methyltransferase [Novosphingobium sp.]|nr:class I SAM-dependent methyltransferase [Novosphingobium sp.]
MKVDYDILKAHDKQAPFYKYRTPYARSLFPALVEKLSITPQSTLLDVCCGQGELAVPLAEHARKVYAIDGAEEMLAHARPHDRVEYARCDVNIDGFAAPAPVDHIVIGRALHWLKPDSLQRLIDANLAEGGKFVICSTYWYSGWDIIKTLNEIAHKYQIVDNYEKGAFDTREKMENVKFSPEYLVKSRAVFKVRPQNLLYHFLSQAYGEKFDILYERSSELSADIQKVVAPFVKNGRVALPLISYGKIFRRD